MSLSSGCDQSEGSTKAPTDTTTQRGNLTDTTASATNDMHEMSWPEIFDPAAEGSHDVENPRQWPLPVLSEHNRDKRTSSTAAI